MTPISKAATSLGDFMLGDQWERPRPSWGKQDLIVPLASVLMAAFGLELIRSFTDFSGSKPLWVEYLTIVSAGLLLVFRRRYPLVTGVLAALHFGFTVNYVGEVGYTLVYQVMIFFAVYSLVAWAQNRRAMLGTVITLLLALIVWLAWMYAVGSAVQDFYTDNKGDGLFPPLTAAVLYTFQNNLLYYLGAVLMGQVAWREAREKTRIRQQSALLGDQADQLAEQAVVTERLRLARELHDVVAHHVSLMGVQAAGARRVLGKDPALAAQALETVEQSSREAVTQMRHLLGTLRAPARAGEPAEHRAPEPTLAELPELIQQANADGLGVELQVAAEQQLLERVAQPVQLSLYRVVQEALTNVRRHSTARHVRVVLRGSSPAAVPGQAWIEVEIVDDGRPRIGTSGSGLGQLGMRERVASHGGSAEIGPRATGGYRVRVRFGVSAGAVDPAP